MSATVGAWNPSAILGPVHTSALDEAALALDDGSGALRELGDECANHLRDVVQAEPSARQHWLQPIESPRLVGWLRVLTLAEEAIPGCDAGAKSPVIQIARLLRERGAYPEDLTPWIKSVSKNRFLPYGSLADRLAQ